VDAPTVRPRAAQLKHRQVKAFHEGKSFMKSDGRIMTPSGPRSGRPVGLRAAARGLTLVELSVGLAVTIMVGAVVATMLFSGFYGTSTDQQSRGLLVSQEGAVKRLNAALRASKMVLARGDNYLVLWKAETRLNQQPNLSELQRIEWNTATHELWSYKAPLGLDDSQDTLYNLASTDFSAVTSALKGTDLFPGILWASDVTGWTTTLDSANPQQANVVGYRFTITLDGASQTAVDATALRCQ